ncbi:hypothetical protein Ava_0156 [Trichormus variabilis ATCC 29413]|uniref:Uncharacterized protein n=2 Tax=Anabaena variabilis TaxID=264691 RepID=Q3MGV4_TRIV2|nr:MULTISPECIES: hypothetical protein [Nostocaceae]ABA19782.1 hypothetical protein Ava_0156 [Trichormus variabilis ATCC 29413]MBC1215637.1 hypothetical protein [Trichormus variabilis ARAD]MBC1255995.1 hypothetical protein [Trichormus variabilis V5]MBC1269341.1 hypothetical protein [Trichormus variabilis FSR]MBC1304206.1 hypothetical protein [Trichormus variabilis N2B]
MATVIYQVLQLDTWQQKVGAVVIFICRLMQNVAVTTVYILDMGLMLRVLPKLKLFPRQYFNKLPAILPKYF